MPNTRKNPRDPNSPFVTAEGMRKAVPFRERFPKLDTPTLTAIADSETPQGRERPLSTEQISLPLSPEMVAELRATGPDWPRLADELLRAALKQRRQATSKIAGA